MTSRHAITPSALFMPCKGGGGGGWERGGTNTAPALRHHCCWSARRQNFLCFRSRKIERDPGSAFKLSTIQQPLLSLLERLPPPKIRSSKRGGLFPLSSKEAPGLQLLCSRIGSAAWGPSVTSRENQTVGLTAKTLHIPSNTLGWQDCGARAQGD